MVIGASDLRDAFWLAEHIRAPEADRTAAGATEARAADGSAEQAADLSERSVAEPAEAESAAVDPPSLPIYAEGTEESTARHRGIGFRSPAVPALRDQLAFTRALRAFGRRVPSRTATLIDEVATVTRIAEEKLWEPAVRPAPERWLNLTLLLDTSASMTVWQQTFAQFRSLTEWLGVFGDVRVREFDATKPIDSASVLRDIGIGRRVVLVVSDLLGGVWQDGTMDAVLREIGRSVPVAVLTLLPQRMWEGTGVEVSAGEVSAVWPGDCNAEWRCDSEPVPIPLLECAPAWVARWTDIVTAAPGYHRIALLDTPPAPPRLTVATAPAPPPACDAAELVDRFRISASTAGFRLGCYLSASVLSLPVMRLVQRVMMPDSDVTHLAEVFLSGLLLRWEGQSTPELVEYDFLPGVREELNGYLLREDALTILRATSEFVTERLGQQPFDFGALLEDPEGAELPVHGGEFGSPPPLAVIAASILARMGGRYAVLADRISAPGPIRPVGQELAANAGTGAGGVGGQPKEPPVETSSLRIGLVDDNLDLVSAFLAGLFEGSQGLQLTARAPTTEALLAMTHDLDLVIMDLFGSRVPPGQRVARIRGAGIENVLIYSGRPTPTSVRVTIDSGAKGVLAKDRPAEKVLEAVRVCASGRHYPSAEWARALVSLTTSDLLTANEQTVLLGFRDDPDPAEFASRLGMSVDDLFDIVGAINDKCARMYRGRGAESWFVAAMGLAAEQPRRFANLLNSLLNEGDDSRIRAELRPQDEDFLRLRLGLCDTPPADLVRELTMFFGELSSAFSEVDFAAVDSEGNSLAVDELLRFELIDLSVADDALRMLRGRAESEAEPFYQLELVRALSGFADRWWAVGDRLRSVDATEEAVDLLRRLERTSLVEFAHALIDLGVRKTLVGDATGGMAAIDEVVSACRRLSITEPEARHFALVRALHDFGRQLVRLGRRTLGLDITLAALALIRQLVRVAPADGVEVDLPLILEDLGAQLAELGRHPEAVEVTREAVFLTQQLADTDPDTYLPLLGSMLQNLGNQLETSGHIREAVQVTQQAVDVVRGIAAESPNEYLPELNDAMMNSAMRFSRAGLFTEAVEAAREAVMVARRLASAEPEVYLPGLIDALQNLAVQYSRAGYLAEAIVATREAESIARRLRVTHPTLRVADPTQAFDYLRMRMEESGHRAETVDVTRQAVLILKRLAATDPDPYLPALAHELNTLGVQLNRTGRRSEAVEVTREALAITRRLTAIDSATDILDIARVLYRLAGLCDRENLHEEALDYAEEAVDLFRRLSAAEPATYERDLVLALDIMALQLSALHRYDRALDTAEEARAICDRVDDVDLLIRVRTTLADILDALGRTEAAAAMRPKGLP
nr:SAV_2336 N-terminal domain-related protein [Nocardia bovistercoris]